MTNRERFKAVMNFRPFDRLPVVEWAGWWDKTIDRWHTEGLPASLTDRYEICEHLGLDVYRQIWMPARTKDCPTAPVHGAGIIQDEKGYDDIRKYLFPATAIDKYVWEQAAEKQRAADNVLWFSLDGFFWFARGLLGIERHLYAFYDQPALMHRINRDLAKWIVEVLEQIFSICTPDFMTFAEDMSYNHGPMLSEGHFTEFLLPYYRMVIPKLADHGVIAIVDSDGDISVPAYWFGEAGLDGILPLERQAGVDIAKLRRDHPRMRFIGHFDKMTMNRGEDAMRREFERLLPTAATGGYLISVDHQTPPGVSLDQYRSFLRLFRECAEEVGKRSQ